MNQQIKKLEEIYGEKMVCVGRAAQGGGIYLPESKAKTCGTLSFKDYYDAEQAGFEYGSWRTIYQGKGDQPQGYEKQGFLIAD